MPARTNSRSGGRRTTGRKKTSARGRTASRGSGRTTTKRTTGRGTARKGAAKRTGTKSTAGARSTARRTSRGGTTAARTGTRRTTKQDAIAVLKSDHRAVEKLFKRYQGLGETSYKSMQTVVAKIIKELSVHASIEEMIVYPAMRRNLPDGPELVAEAMQEHQQAKEALATLEKMDATDEQFDELVTMLIKEVKHHVKEEETELFPKFRKEMSREDLVQMGAQLKLAKKNAPTRPHPKASNRGRKR